MDVCVSIQGSLALVTCKTPASVEIQKVQIYVLEGYIFQV